MSTIWQDKFTCESYSKRRQANLEYERNFLDHLMVLLGERNNVLDLCCGAGIQMQYIISKGKYVIGVDSSEVMIAIAQQALKSASLTICEDVENIVLDRRFNLATFFFGSFVFPDIKKAKKVLINVYHHLNDQGILVIDNRNFSIIYELLGSNNFIELESHYELQEFYIDSLNEVVTTKTHYISKDKNIENYSVELHARYYSLAILRDILEEIGFIIDEVYGDYDLSNYSYKYSHRQIIIARKVGK